MTSNTQVPVLVFLDVAVHEVGHKIFSPFGDLIMLIMGTGFQILFPLVVGVVLAVWRRDLIAWGVCWAWSANAMCDGARYIFDAPRGELMLMGASDGLGDWSKILGPEHFDKLYLADSIATKVRTAGYVLWFVALGLAAWVIVRDRLHDRATAETPRPRAIVKPGSPRPVIDDEHMWR